MTIKTSGDSRLPWAVLRPSNRNRTIRLRRKLPLLLLAFLFVNQLFNPARIWVGLILGFIVLLLLSYGWARLLAEGLSARRNLRGAWVLVGDVMAETFVVENASDVPALWVEVIDRSDLPGYRPDWVASVNNHGQQSYRAEGRCQHRGVFTLGPWELRSGDPLGIFEVIVEMPDTRSILVYPRAMHLPDLRLPRGDAPGPARTIRRTPNFTTTVSSVRPYVPGDSLRRIHWRTTAHWDQLMVKEFDLEPSGDLWLVLDLDQAVHVGQGAESTLEYAITLAASVATQMLAENRRVGLVAQDTLISPQASQVQLWRILEALAHAELVSDVNLATLLRDVRDNLGRGRTLVTITPSTEPEWIAELLDLTRRGNAPAVLLLDGDSFLDSAGAAESLSDDSRANLQVLLAEHAVPSHLIDRSFTFQPLQRITRTRTELRTLSATGRVIAVEVEEVV
ncbi:MAG: DUF58 domain-containing protein [Chloroflexota bacterium]|nr:DUF58 domain-containing protein [Chloroflexota bacterium]